jgi:biotin transport system ATP-binding protein
VIEVSDLTHHYGETVALEAVTLSVPDGQFLLVVGPNGSGKTTLVRHFNALAEPDSGSVLVDGQAASEHPVAARTAVGMVFQHPRDQLVAATVGEDVAFGPENLGLDREEIDRRVEAALSAVDMADRREDRVHSLSGGEQARVAIAGALAMEPSHLVLDEPLAGLDRRARESVLARLDEVHADGTTVVVVTHDLRDLADRAERVVALADGRVAADGPLAEVRETLADVDVDLPTC